MDCYENRGKYHKIAFKIFQYFFAKTFLKLNIVQILNIRTIPEKNRGGSQAGTFLNPLPPN